MLNGASNPASRELRPLLLGQCYRGPCAIWDICLKRILHSNIVKSLKFITAIPSFQKFWNFAQSAAVPLPCSVQNFKTIGQLDMLTARRRLKSPQSLSSTSAHPTMVTLPVVNIRLMNGWLLFQTLTLKFQLQGQGHGYGQRARSYNRHSIILTHLVFISHQSDQQFQR